MERNSDSSWEKMEMILGRFGNCTSWMSTMILSFPGHRITFFGSPGDIGPGGGFFFKKKRLENHCDSFFLYTGSGPS